MRSPCINTTGTLTFTGGSVTLNDASTLSDVILHNGGTKSLTINGANGSSILNVALGDALNNIIAVDGTGGVTISSNIGEVSRGMDLTKMGFGTTTLSGANTYSGGTTVSAGTLLINNPSGSGTGPGAVAVNGGTLGGTGSIAGAVTVASGASLSPGATGGSSIGKLTVGNGGATTGLNLNGTYQVNLTGSTTPTAGTTYSQVSVVGALTLNPTSSLLAVNATSNVNLAVGQVFSIALNDGTEPVSGTFGNLTEGAIVKDNLGDTYTLSYLANADGGTLGNDISLTVAGVVPIPEPTTVLGGVLLFGVAGWGQRRRWRGPVAPGV